jgi:hypothetical protein
MPRTFHMTSSVSGLVLPNLGNRVEGFADSFASNDGGRRELRICKCKMCRSAIWPCDAVYHELATIADCINNDMRWSWELRFKDEMQLMKGPERIWEETQMKENRRDSSFWRFPSCSVGRTCATCCRGKGEKRLAK